MKVDFEKAVKSGVEQAMQEFYKMHYDQTIKTAKSEAVKEFAETVKKNHLMLFNNIYSHKEFVDAIDRLVKEMVGEKK